jgi:FAD:protein FMN transferase
MSQPSQVPTHRMNRRGFLKITAACGLAAGLSLPVLRQLAAIGELAELRETRFMIGTVIHLNLVAADQENGRRVMQAVFAEIERLAAIFDPRRAETPLARLNASAQLDNAPLELIQVLGKAIHYSSITEGAFDVTVKPLQDARTAGLPIGSQLLDLVDYRSLKIEGSRISLLKPGMGITLDGIAKGWIVDVAVALLGVQGYENALVEAGGDLVAAGLNGPAKPWKVGIAHPRAADGTQTIASIQVTKSGLATSGDYRNAISPDFVQNHIIDPHSGFSPAELASATVIAPTCADADALSTALMVLGTDRGLELIDRMDGFSALTVSKDLNVRRSLNFPRG